jgi:acyl-CoA thioesterase FadM
MPQEELFTTYTDVKPEWIDYNGHMNMGYYLVAFDHIATDSFYDSMSIGVAHNLLWHAICSSSAKIPNVRHLP